MVLQRLLLRLQTARLIFLTVAGLLILAACVPQTSGYRSTSDYHTVRSGETLFEIAWQYGKDHHDLARWNKLGNGSLI